MKPALDLFVEEDIEYAQRRVAAGVPTELLVVPGAFHGEAPAPSASRPAFASSARRRPEIWRADTGATEAVSYRIEDGGTVVPLEIEGDDSFFVVFREPQLGLLREALSLQRQRQ